MSPTCPIIQRSEVADLTNAVHPAVHLLLRFGHQVEDPRGGLHHEQMLVLELSPDQPLFLHQLDLTLLQVDGADGLPGRLVPVVLQHVGVPAHTTTAEDKPSLPPRLGDKSNQIKMYLYSPFYTQACHRGLHIRP